VIRRATTIVRLFLLASIATGCVEQARSTVSPYSYQILVGVWRWWPRPTTQQTGWTAQPTITHVSDWGRVSAIWQDTNDGAIPFTTQARVEEGKIKMTFGSRATYHLEYDRDTDTLSGPITNTSPLFDFGGTDVYKSAYFRRTK
jgi:hypothetical protein